MAERRPYQDRWRDGVLVEKGRRECAGRFLAIAGHVGEVATVVDVGGWDGYFSRRFAEAGATAHLFEPRNVADLPPNVIHHQVRVDASTEFPRVDVALALSVLHHLPDWEQVYARLRARSRVLIVEAAHPGELDGELSPTLVDTGDRIGPVHERVVDEGTVIHSTPGPNHGVRRPIVAIPNVAEGVVEAGKGRASEVMRDRPVDLWGPLGYEPVAGTLNLKVGRKGRSWVRRLPNPVTLDEAGGGSAGPYWPVRVAGVDCHVRCSKALTVVELVAPVVMRDFFGLADGDTVDIEVR